MARKLVYIFFFLLSTIILSGQGWCNASCGSFSCITVNDTCIIQSIGVCNISYVSTNVVNNRLRFFHISGSIDANHPFINTGDYRSCRDAELLNRDTFFNNGDFLWYGDFDNRGVFINEYMPQSFTTGISSNNKDFSNNGIFVNEVDNTFTNEDEFFLDTRPDPDKGLFINKDTFINNGLFRIDEFLNGVPGNAKFNNEGTFINNGAFENLSTISDIGIFKGSGSFLNYGVLSPGNSPGNLEMDGDLTFSDDFGYNPTYIAELSSLENDTIKVGGSVSVVGTLEVMLINGKVPTQGERFTIMTYGGITGTFDNVILPAGYDWSLDYGATSVTLTVNSVLPVELASFEGNLVKGYVQLDWITNTEVNNDYFVLERSGDGKNFVEIGRVQGYGSTTETVKYKFLDRNPVSGKNYYRLRQVDYDGSEDYSKVILVDRKASYLDYKILANPIEDNVLNLMIGRLKGDPISISIIDIKGAELLSQKLGMGENAISMAWYESGLYVLLFTYKGKRYVEKIVVP